MNVQEQAAAVNEAYEQYFGNQECPPNSLVEAHLLFFGRICFDAGFLARQEEEIREMNE